MDVLLTYVAAIASAIFGYGLLIVVVSHAVHRLQPKTGPVSDIDDWHEEEGFTQPSGNDVSGEENTQSLSSGSSTPLDSIPVAEIDSVPMAAIADPPNVQNSQDNFVGEVSEWSENYRTPGTEIEMAYQNIATVEYRKIGIGRSLIIALSTAIATLFAMVVVSLLYFVFAFAFSLPRQPNTTVRFLAAMLVLIGVSLVVRLLFQRSSFGSTALAVICESVLISFVAYFFI